ncbi:MAG: DNA-binding protein [Gammaproteobacteria bacterium]|nr:DNA-binding protein [Gammaproteobacteria bacterium]
MATQRRTLSGQLPVAELPRLVPLLRAESGDVAFELDFDKDPVGAPFVKGTVRAVVTLQCQRCMQEMVCPITANINLGIVRNREAVGQLSSELDPLMLSDGDVSAASIVEDELILALPIVAMHEVADCPRGDLAENEGDSMSGSERKKPFAALADLMNQDKP